MEYKQMRKMEYSISAGEVLVRIENLIINRNKQDFVMDLISEFIFLEKSKNDSRKHMHQQPNQMSLIQEFQLVLVLCEYFSRPGPDSTRNAVYLSLFGNLVTPNRSSVMLKLVSTAISASIASLLSAAGTWMQQLGCTSAPSLELVQHLIKDFITFSKKTPEQLKQLPLVAPRFAVNFMTGVTDLYMNDLKSETTIVPLELLEVFTEWVTDNPALCFVAQQPPLLPSGAIAMPVLTPLSGLIRWCVLAPALHQKEFYDRLHLALLETLTQVSPNGPPTALNAQHLVQIINSLKCYARKLLSENVQPETEENYNMCMERFAQCVQVSLATKCIYGNLAQLLCMLETLPNNFLMDIVIKANKSS